MHARPHAPCALHTTLLLRCCTRWLLPTTTLCCCAMDFIMLAAMVEGAARYYAVWHIQLIR